MQIYGIILNYSTFAFSRKMCNFAQTNRMDMKKLVYIIAAAAALLAVGCKKEKIDPASPAIVWESNPSFGQVELTNSLDAVVTVSAPGGFQGLKLVLGLGSFNILANPFISISSNKGGSVNPVLDLIGDATSVSFANGLGMSVGPALKSRTETKLNLKAVLEKILEGQIVDNNTTFTLEVRAESQNGKTVSKTAKFHFTAAPTISWKNNPTFAVVDLDAAPIDCQVEIRAPGKIEKLTVKLEDGAYPTFVERFKTRTTDGTTLYDLTSDANDKGAFSGGLPAKAAVADKDQVVLDFSFMFEEGRDMKSACMNTFTITAVDKNGKETRQQVQFKKN